MSVVLDSSAVLALLNEERGGDAVIPYLPEAIINAVNLVEVGSKLLDGGMTIDRAQEAIGLLRLRVVDFDASLAGVATELRSVTRALGLSLGDRACLALALREGVTAITADRQWSELDIGCEIELIR